MFNCRFEYRVSSRTDLGVETVDSYEGIFEIPFLPAVGQRFGRKNSSLGAAVSVRWDFSASRFEIDLGQATCSSLQDRISKRDEMRVEGFRLVGSHAV